MTIVTLTKDIYSIVLYCIVLYHIILYYIILYFSFRWGWVKDKRDLINMAVNLTQTENTFENGRDCC